MKAVNLYRINTDMLKSFEKNLLQHFNKEGGTVSAGEMQFTFYIDNKSSQSLVDWQWILNSFGNLQMIKSPSPRAVLIVRNKSNVYACTFGHSHFLVDKYCDADFAFKLARKLRLQKINTTILSSPNSRKNKTVSTYIDYRELEFESGEAFAKLKCTVDLGKRATLCSESFEFGHSVKFKLKTASLFEIRKMITYAEFIERNVNDLNKIPVYQLLTDDAKIENLWKLFTDNVKDKLKLCFSELDVIGVIEVFNAQIDNFQLVFDKKKSDVLSDINYKVVNDFITKKCKKSISEALRLVDVVVYLDNEKVYRKKLVELIDYIDDQQRCVLSQGKWYHYNDDFLSYLADSLSELDVQYNPDFDFDEKKHDEFISKIKSSGVCTGLSDTAVKQKYYAERVFNMMRAEQNGYVNYDRQNHVVNGEKVEAMDLYNPCDKSMIAVKIGNGSGKLCYAVDQSLGSLKLYQQGDLQLKEEIDAIGIWLILTRESEIEQLDGKPDINSLKMLLLKIRLDAWKKAVRLAGYKPIIYLNYRRR